MVQLYRKKPVEIEAIQLTTENLYECVEFIGNEKDYTLEDDNLTIHTLEGNMLVSEHDYIIKGVKDEFYPCKPDIFEITYERVEI